MNREIPTLGEVAEEMIEHGAHILKVSEELLESRYLLVTAYGDRSTLGKGTDRYAKYRSTETVRVGDELFQFDYEFDPFGSSVLNSVPLYAPEEFAAPETGFEATSLESGLNALREASAGDSE